MVWYGLLFLLNENCPVSEQKHGRNFNQEGDGIFFQFHVENKQYLYSD